MDHTRPLHQRSSSLPLSRTIRTHSRVDSDGACALQPNCNEVSGQWSTVRQSDTTLKTVPSSPSCSLTSSTTATTFSPRTPPMSSSSSSRLPISPPDYQTRVRQSPLSPSFSARAKDNTMLFKKSRSFLSLDGFQSRNKVTRSKSNTSLKHFFPFRTPEMSTTQPAEIVTIKRQPDLCLQQKCIYELYSTEKLYAQDLKLIVEEYVATSFQSGLSGIMLKQLFSNVKEVLEISLGFIHILESLIPRHIFSQVDSETPHIPPPCTHNAEEGSGDPTYIGQAFLMFLSPEFYYAHDEYVRNHARQAHLCQSIHDTPESRGRTWLYECLKRTCSSRSYSLESLLIKPVQRLSKYPLFLKTLVKCSPVEFDVEALEQAQRVIGQYIQLINSRV